MLMKIKKLRDSAIIPARATDGSAGMDIYADIPGPVTVQPHSCERIPSGVAVSLESRDYGAFLFARSGLAVKHGLTPANCVGVIDSDYRGEIIVNLVNRLDEPYTVHPGERVAQLVILPVVIPEIEISDELDCTERGEGGFGSTGRK